MKLPYMVIDSETFKFVVWFGPNRLRVEPNQLGPNHGLWSGPKKCWNQSYSLVLVFSKSSENQTKPDCCNTM